MKLGRKLGWVLFAWFALLLVAVPVSADTGSLPADLQEKLDSLPDNATRIELLQKKLESSPDDPALHFALGNLYLDEGKSEPAAKEFATTTQLDPGFLGGWVNLGNAQDDLGQLDKAMNSYHQALQISPNDEKALCNLGGVYFKKREVAKALKAFQTAIEHHPDSQLAHYNLAILFADSEVYREARREWEKVVAVDPKSDLGERSAANIKIIEDLMKSEMPDLPKEGGSSGQ